MESERTASPPMRRGWVAVVFALINPLFGMLYVGRPRRALAYVLLELLCPVGAYLLARNGLWIPKLPWTAFLYVVQVAGVVDSYRIATGRSNVFLPRWFTSWKVLATGALALAALILGLRELLYATYQNPSASMLPTMHERDQFFVSKGAFRRRLPARGDVIVFEAGPGLYYVKRVVGLPGDVVVYDSASALLTVNGTAADVMPLGSHSEDGPDVARETFGGRSYLVQFFPRMRSRVGGTYRVPAESYFVLGDNRDSSNDSRFPGVGFVPAASIVGRVTWIFWNDGEPTRAGIVPE